MLELKLRGDVWYVMGTVTTLDGETVEVRRSTKFKAHQKAMAELRLSQILGETVKNGGPTKKPYQETVSELIRIYVGKPDGAGDTNERALAKFEDAFGTVKIGDLTVKQINDWAYGKGRSPAYVRRLVGCVNTMLRYCENYGVKLPPKLAGTMPPPPTGRCRWLTAEERDRFIEEFGKRGPYHRALAIFLFFTGARIGEAQNLKWADVDAGRATLVCRKGKGKEEKKRAVPLIEEVLDELEKLPRRNQFVFSLMGDNPLSYVSIIKNWHDTCRALGIEDFRIHDARHTFASLLGQTGEVELQEIQQLLGHASLEMTLRYKHLLPSKTMNAVKALSKKAAAKTASFTELDRTVAAQIPHST